MTSVEPAQSDRFRQLYLEHRVADQLVYYQARAREYERAHRQALGARNALFLLSALAAGGAEVTDDRLRSALGILAALFAALAGAIVGYEALIGYPSLAKIYRDASLSLRAAQIGIVQSDVITEEQFQRVEQVFRTEVGQWGQLSVANPDQNPGDASVPGQSRGSR